MLKTNYKNPPRVICINVFSDPGVAGHAAVSISRQNFKNSYIGLCRAEPTFKETVDIFADIPETILPLAIELNAGILGYHTNTIALLDSAFQRGAEQVVYVQDNIILSDDAIDVCNSFFDLPDCDDYLALNLLNPFSFNGCLGDLFEVAYDFNALGFAMTSKAWYKWVLPALPKTPAIDKACHQLIYKKDLKILRPSVTRSVMIEENGLELYSGPPVKEFKILT